MRLKRMRILGHQEFNGTQKKPAKKANTATTKAAPTVPPAARKKAAPAVPPASTEKVEPPVPPVPPTAQKTDTNEGQ